jgi:hypothetical protein
MKVRRIDFSPDEFLAGTIELSDAECGLYWRLCSLIYSRGRAVSRDELRAVSPSHGNTFNALLRRLIALGKVIPNDADLIVKRCANELETVGKRIANLRQNGAKGGRPPNKTATYQNQKVISTHARAELPTTNYQLEERTTAYAVGANAPSDDPVKELFDRGLKILGMAQRALLGKFRKRHGDVVVLEAICACEREHPSDPAAYFVRCCETHAVTLAKKSPSTTLWEGGYRAAESYIRDHGIERDDNLPAEPLLGGR